MYTRTPGAPADGRDAVSYAGSGNRSWKVHPGWDWPLFAFPLLLPPATSPWQFNSSTPTPPSFHRTERRILPDSGFSFQTMYLSSLDRRHWYHYRSGINLHLSVYFTHSFIHSEAQTEWAPTAAKHSKTLPRFPLSQMPQSRARPCSTAASGHARCAHLKRSVSTEMCCQCKKHCSLKTEYKKNIQSTINSFHIGSMLKW